MMNKRVGVLAVVAASIFSLFFAPSGFAMSALRYDAERAIVNPQYSDKPGGFTFTFGQGGTAETFVFSQDLPGFPQCPTGFTHCEPGYLTQIDTLGTATLKGDAWSMQSADKGFHVDIQLSGLVTLGGILSPGSPKKELKDIAYSTLGGPVDPTTWTYYTTAVGTLTGFGSYTGYVVTLSNFGPPFQIGNGANGKNISFGGSGWFQVLSVATSNALLPHLTVGSIGDGNINLVNPVVITEPNTAIPEPSTVILFGSALVGMLLYRRKS